MSNNTEQNTWNMHHFLTSKFDGIDGMGYYVDFDRKVSTLNGNDPSWKKKKNDLKINQLQEVIEAHGVNKIQINFICLVLEKQYI